VCVTVNLMQVLGSKAHATSSVCKNVCRVGIVRVLCVCVYVCVCVSVGVGVGVGVGVCGCGCWCECVCGCGSLSTKYKCGKAHATSSSILSKL